MQVIINSRIKYSQYTSKDFDNWLVMALELWPDYTEEDLRKELKTIARSKKQVTFIARDESKYAGFINASLRYEYIEGSESSPVGYVEGIYIRPEYRKQGIASQLLKTGEKWAIEKGVKEMASDTWLRNKNGQNFHEKLGFKLADKIVHYIKKIG